MAESSQTQLAFAGVDAVTAPHLVDQSKCQSALNVDFGAEPGAAYVRRGCQQFAQVALGTNPVTSISRNFNNSNNIDASPFYVLAGSTVYRGVSGTYTAITTGANNSIMVPGFYHNNFFIANTVNIKDDGTNVSDWIKQSPASAPGATVGTLAPLAVVTNSVGAYNVIEGTAVLDTSGTPVYWNTDVLTNRLTILNTNLITNDWSMNGTHTIGDYGVDMLFVKFNDPSRVTRISRDYSIGDASFTNYWHTELLVANNTADPTSAQPDVNVLIDGSIGLTPISSNTATPPDQMSADARYNNRPAVTQISSAPSVFNLWAVPRTTFSLVNESPTPTGWTNIQAVRVVVECTDQTAVLIQGWEVRGAQDYPKNDPQLGYQYWQTWCTVDTNTAILGESAASPVSSRCLVQNGQIQIVTTNTPTGTQHGLTHSILYAQGGYLNDAYAVATFSGFNGTWTDTMNDIDVLSVGRIMTRNVMTQVQFDNDTEYVSEPFYARLFTAAGNQINWTLPGKPDVFPLTSYSLVSHSGDEIHGLVVWAPSLVIINRDSVYELTGTVFEGPNINWSLSRSGSRHGSKAPQTIVKTPYGIPLLDYDGLYMYVPGQGVDQTIEWVAEQIGDVWRGNGANDPAALKGSRVPTLSSGYILGALGAFADDKYYLALPTGTSTQANTLFVLNFRTKQVQWYQYPWTMTSLYADMQNNRLLAGLSNGTIMQLELGTLDQTALGTFTAIPWNLTTRAWSVPTDNRLENIAADIETPQGVAVISAIYDGTSTSALGTASNVTRDWIISPQSGALSRDVVFTVNGTQSGTSQSILHQMKWTSLPEPERVKYYRTEHDKQGADTENIWEIQYSDLEIINPGVVTAVTFIDNLPVMTNTFLGDSSGRTLFPVSFPGNTYGNLGYVVYTVTAGSTCVFKHWDTEFTSNPEPSRVAFVSAQQQTFPSPVWMRTWSAQLNPFGSCVGRLYLDDVLVVTTTFTGTNRAVFTYGLDLDTAQAVRIAQKVEATYTAGAGVLKHYNTQFETEPRPFFKNTWLVTYKKSGGATQLDMARFWSLDAECLTGTATVTAVWNIDGVAFTTNTLTVAGRAWQDRIALPPGGRGYLFQLRLYSDQAFQVFKSNLDIEMVGIKGFSRRTYAGTPEDNN
jgi:hypothetical protein